MPKFEVDIPHALPPAEAKERIAGATGKLEQKYGATCSWKSDTELMVQLKGVDAKVSIEPARVHVDLNLGFMLVPLANAIKGGITKELSGVLAQPA
jgi:putative polyhydroxyalkanoate system protein